MAVLFLIGSLTGAISPAAARDQLKPGLLLLRAVDSSVIQADPRSTITVAFRLVNTSSTAQEFQAALELPDGWGLLTEEAPFRMESGEETIRLVGFILPPTAAAAEYRVVYRVRPVQSSGQGEEAEIAVRVPLLAGLVLQVLEKPRLAVAGESYRLKFLLTNTSNAAGTVALDIESSEGFKYAPHYSPLRLEPGESRPLEITVATDVRLRAGVEHHLELKARFIDLEGQSAPASVLTSVEVVPLISGDNNAYRRLPLELKLFGVSRSGSGTQPQVGFGCVGSLNDKGTTTIDLLYRGPRSRFITNFYPWEDEARLSLSAPLGEIHIGDRVFTVSRLLEYGHYRRGVDGQLNLGHFLLRGFYMVDPFLAFNQKEMGFTLGYSPSPRVSLSASYLRNKERPADGFVDIEPPVDSDTLSLQAQLSAAKALLNFNLEYALGRNRAQNGILGQAYWVEAFGNTKGFGYRLYSVKADASYAGNYRNLEFNAGNVSLDVLKNLGINLNYRYQKLNQSLDPDLPASLEKSGQGGIYYRLGRSTTLTFDYRDMRWQDLLPDPQYHFNESAFRLGASQNLSSLSLNLSVDAGQTKDLLTGKSARLMEYVGQVSWSATSWLSLGGYLDYRDQQKGFAGDRFNQLTADFNFNLTWGRGSLYAAYRTSFHKEFATVIAGDISQLEQALLHSYDLLDAGFRYVLGNGQSIGLRLRGLARMGMPGKMDFITLAEYTIPVGLPVGRRTDTGILKGRLYDAERGGAGLGSAVVRANGLAAVTDAQGNFVFHGLKPGSYAVNFDRASLNPDRVAKLDMPLSKSIEGGITSEVNIGVARAATLSGQVLLYRFANVPPGEPQTWGQTTAPQVSEDHGLAGIQVDLESEGLIRSQTTDRDGWFAFYDIYPGTWTLRVPGDEIPALHYLEKDALVLTLAPGEQGQVTARVLPTVRQVQIVDVGEISLKAGVLKKAPAAVPAVKRQEPFPLEKPLSRVLAHTEVPPRVAEEVGHGCILKNVVVRNIAGGVEVELILNSECWPRVFQLSAPGRIIIDIPRIEFIEASRLIQVNSGPLRSVRTGLLNSTTARVVIELDGGVRDFKPEKTSTGLKVIISNSLK